MRWSPFQLRQALRVLGGSGVVAHAAEGVWGLACDPWSAPAVAQILELKGRSADKGLLLIAADSSQLTPWLEVVPEPARERALASWPGPCAWLFPDTGLAPAWIRGKHDSLGLRVPGNASLRRLCAAFGGPLVSTSANPGGRPPARSALQVRRYFGAGVDLYLSGRGRLSGRPSVIREALSGRLIRGCKTDMDEGSEGISVETAA